MYRPRPCPRWDCINARQRKSDKAAPARARHVLSLVPVSAQNAAKPRGSPHTALEFTAETDSALEEASFELPVPLSGQHSFRRLATPRDQPAAGQKRILTNDRDRFTVRRARLAPAMI